MVVAIIPARSGSRGIKHKNIRPLHGRPLLVYPIKAAQRSKYINRIYVSTDSVKYANIAVENGAAAIMRPKELAEDVPTEWVIQHAVEQIEQEIGKKVDLVCTLQCTTPLMTAYDIDQCIRAVLDYLEADSAMTVCEVEFPPYWLFKIDDGWLKPWMHVPLKGEWGIRQAHEPLYRPNGAVYVTKRDVLMEKGRIIGERCRAVKMLREFSVDIDTEFDFIIAEAVISRGLYKLED